MQRSRGRLETSAQHDLHFPANSIPDATTLFVRLYPGPLSQVIEGMDSILSMPGGCFEQTSSSTYPNVLALDYMKHTRKLTPETHAKAVKQQAAKLAKGERVSLGQIVKKWSKK